MMEDFVEHSYQRGQAALSRRTEADRKRQGQFLTPPAVARFMAWQLMPIQSGSRLLDPACGSGVLACAMIERAMLAEQPVALWLDCYDIDDELCDLTRQSLDEAAQEARLQGVDVNYHVHACDYVLDEQPIQAPLFATVHETRGQSYSHVIANPPYFKLNGDDPRVKFALAGKLGHANIYALFMSLAVRQLADDGRASFIVPRSFCSGDYFNSFRRQFMHEAIPLSVHLFDSRQETFKADEVLQENVILLFRRRPAISHLKANAQVESERVTVSASSSAADLFTPQVSRSISVRRHWRQHNRHLFFKLPLSEYDEQIVETVEAWPGSLEKYGLEVSTGPVVAFRAAEFLAYDDTAVQGPYAPLLWMQHVSRHRIQWPLQNTTKPQFIQAKAASGLLVPARNYVLVRRFSAKEEPHRVVAAPLIATQLDSEHIGLENHLNYIHGSGSVLSIEQTLGLSAVLNSNLIDRYIRIVNGNTQINAAELRALSLPAREIVEQIGARLIGAGANASHTVEVDELSESVVFSTLLEAGLWPENLPNIQDSRITMNKMQKIQQAQQILQALGLPPAQQNEQSALTLLVLCQLSENTPWRKASQKPLRIHDILTEIKDRYDREYAENTRETIRRQVIHQFEQAGLIARNPDTPDLPTNSPRTCYVLTDAALQVLRSYGTKGWHSALTVFIENQGTLLNLYTSHESLSPHR